MAAKKNPLTLWFVAILVHIIPYATSIKYEVQIGEELIAYDSLKYQVQVGEELIFYGKQPREEDYVTEPLAVSNYTSRSNLLSGENSRDATLTYTYDWTNNDDLLQWVHTGLSASTYPYAYVTEVDGVGTPWATRNGWHYPHVFSSPTWCDVTSVQFKANGGVSETSDPSDSRFLGIVLVSDAGAITKKYTQPSNTHSNMATTWSGLDGGCYHVEVRDGKVSQDWAHIWIQDVVVLTSLSSRSQAAGIGGASATGDPHLKNVHGEKFDLMQPGKHLLIQIPRRSDKAMLRVDAVAQQFGGQCADLYFQELNITGSWVEAKQAGGLHYRAQDSESQPPRWEFFGNAQLKVAHGRTQEGTTYLNLYVKDLHRTRFPIGGLLGDDDHTEAATPAEGCGHRLAL